jgi:hypothetical protein
MRRVIQDITETSDAVLTERLEKGAASGQLTRRGINDWLKMQRQRSKDAPDELAVIDRVEKIANAVLK